MKCPNCQSEFQSAIVPNNYGQKFEVFKCPHCQSFWFKKMQLYGFPADKASEIDTPGKINIATNLVCPEDQTPLTDFKDPNVPSEFTGFRCSDCGGMFVPKSQLIFYKKYQEGNKAYIDIPRKAAAALVSLGVVFILSLLFLASSEVAIRADVTSDISRQSSMWDYRTIAFIMAFVILGIMIIIFLNFLKHKNKIHK